VLHSFGTSPNYTDGANPTGGLIADKFGALYGTTQGGGIGGGVLFQLAPTGSSWTETVLHTFRTAPGASDGGNPADTLMFSLGNAGPMYGTTLTGGPANVGVAFELSFAGGVWTETVLHSFGTVFPTEPFADGATPMSGLIIGSDGGFYGTTFYGGAGAGVIYEIYPPYLQEGLALFRTSYDVGANPVGGVVSSNGSMFGTTARGGSGYGIFYVLCLSAAAC
jgi:uncharacterized repeat protein (TIGR03803 family)